MGRGTLKDAFASGNFTEEEADIFVTDLCLWKALRRYATRPTLEGIVTERKSESVPARGPVVEDQEPRLFAEAARAIRRQSAPELGGRNTRGADAVRCGLRTAHPHQAPS